MGQPLVIGYHLIWTAYGCWLPNDPRGSGSFTVRQDVLADLGKLHYGRKKIQPPRHEIRDFYEKAAPLLKHPVLMFDEIDRSEIADTFAEVIAAQRYTCYACAIMPDHIHVLIRKHKHDAEEMVKRLQDASVERLCSSGRRSSDHPTWTRGTGWIVFLDHPDDIHRTIKYIRRNPILAGMQMQNWPFVTAYDKWPLHAGHSPNSPYVRALKAAGRYP